MLPHFRGARDGAGQIRDYLKTELVIHAGAEREAVLARAEQLLREGGITTKHTKDTKGRQEKT
jgi:hypothetical protein